MLRERHGFGNLRQMSRWGQRWAWPPEAGHAEPWSTRAIAEAKELSTPVVGVPFSTGTSEALVTYPLASCLSFCRSVHD